MLSSSQRVFVLLLILSQTYRTCSFPSPVLRHEQDQHQPLSSVSQFGNRLASRVQEQRLGLPTPQDLEAIKKVAQILVMLGEQVIPTIIGEPPSSSCDVAEEVANDPVDNKGGNV